MKRVHSAFPMLAIVLAAMVFTDGNEAAAQTAPAISPAISTPDKVETRIGPLEPFFATTRRPSEVEPVL
jgi:hypothetical protein